MAGVRRYSYFVFNPNKKDCSDSPVAPAVDSKDLNVAPRPARPSVQQQFVNPSFRLPYAIPFTGVPVASATAAVCSDFRTTFAARGFSHNNAINAAIRSQMIMAQNTFDHDPVFANSHAAPGPANPAATPLAVYTMP